MKRFFYRLVLKIKENLLLNFLVFLLVVIFLTLVGVLFSDSFQEYIANFMGLTGEKSKRHEALKFLGIGMGGILVALQAVMSYKRAKAMEETAKSQADAVSKTEDGLRQERLKNAIEHLGNEKESMRWGGAYELFHLAKDSKELRQTALDLLCLHIRQTTGEKEYKKKHKSKPSEEVQSILRLLFMQEHEVFKGLRIELQGSWLNGADLSRARLEEAILRNVHLRGSNLEGARLQGSILIDAQLQGVSLVGAHLQMARLDRAYLQGCNLWKTRLQGVFLNGARLQGSILIRTQLQAVFFDQTHLEGVTSMNKSLSISFEDHIREQIGKKTDLSGAIFEGGLKREDMKSLVVGLSNRKAKRFAKEPEIAYRQASKQSTAAS